MQNLDLILVLTFGLGAALVFGYLTHRLGLSPIVGFLLAGIAVGPNTPGLVVSRELAEQFAEVGVILLMFGVGLQFHLRELMAVRRIAVPGAVVQSVVATLLMAWIARWMDWEWASGIVFGLAISVASTVVLVRVLTDNRDLHTPAGHIAVGWLVVEDIFTVVVLVLLPTLFGSAAEQRASIPVALGLAALKIGSLALITFLIGGRAIPWLLEHVAKANSRELFTLTVLVLALGIALGSAKVFGVSMALGAFVAGMIVGRSEFSLRAATEALPMRDAFAVLFFVSAGMLFDPVRFMENPTLVACTVAVVMIGKPIAALAIALLFRYPLGVALTVAVSLAQIGEFSFILGNVGRSMGIISDGAYNAILATAIISISANPLLYRLVIPSERAIQRNPRLARWLGSRSAFPRDAGMAPASDKSSARAAQHRAVVVGYGPVGQTVARLLRDNEIEVTVIEMNLETTRRLREAGIPAIYGDATSVEILKHAGIAKAEGLVLSADGLRNSQEIIRMARELNPGIQVLARSAYVQEIKALRDAGANAVFSGEGEVALAFTVEILRELGATPEQIDRERERVQQEIFDANK